MPFRKDKKNEYNRDSGVEFHAKKVSDGHEKKLKQKHPKKDEAADPAITAGELSDGLELSEKKKSAIDDSLLEVKKQTKPKVINFNLDTAERFFPDTENGLSDSQIDDRVAKGFINYITKKKGKTYRAIFISNIFTFFNILTFIVGAVLIFSGNTDFGNLFFLVIITANICIGIFQEIRSKRMIDRLSIISAPTATVVRSGKRKVIPISEIVLDDIIFTETGKQISADAVVVAGSCEVNESMLTGESEAVKKNVGDILYSGCFVSAGTCYARVDKVGDTNYIETLTSHAKNYKKPKSQLQNSIRLIMKIVTCFIIPIAILMVYIKLHQVDWSAMTPDTRSKMIAGWAGSIIGMIPAGMFLLTSVALAMGVIRLSQRHTLVQDLYCIEMLARADVLCLDKTGTLTDGSMQVNKTVPLIKDENAESLIAAIIGSMLSATEDNNQTALALAAKYGYNTGLKPKTVLPFSSQRKLSAVTFEEDGTYLLGAPEFVLKDMGIKLDRLVAEYAAQGYRVICLAQVSGDITSDKGEYKIPSGRKPLALIVIEDHIRDDATCTIKWFKENDVAVKVISGDNPITVSEVARRVGVENAELYISLDGLSAQEVAEAANKYTVFGRVTPEQKSLLVRSIKAKGHTVAMTGDGVNDILAMREADCSIAIASGAEAARNVSHLVLLDSNFTSMPDVVMEGRRVVNNITKSSSLFLTKTFMSIVLSIVFLFFKNDYPLFPKNLLLLEIFVIAMPSFCLALQSNSNRIKGNFLANVISRAIPGGVALVISVLGVYFYKSILTKSGLNWNPPFAISDDTYIAMTVIAMSFTGTIVLAKICEPFNFFRSLVFLASIVLMFVAVIVDINGATGGEGSLFGIKSFSIKADQANLMHLMFIFGLVLLSYFITTFFMRVLKSLNVMYD